MYHTAMRNLIILAKRGMMWEQSKQTEDGDVGRTFFWAGLAWKDDRHALTLPLHILPNVDIP